MSLGGGNGDCTVDGTRYFVADAGVNSHELWRSDGTSSGTILSDDRAPGSRNPLMRLQVDDNLFFSAKRDDVGRELFAFRIPPPVTNLDINGSAEQRSRVTTLQVQLSASTEVSLFQNPGAVVLTRSGGGNVTVGFGLVITPGSGNAAT